MLLPTSSFFSTACTTSPPTSMVKALREASRVLVPNGLCYISEPLAEGPFFEACRGVDDETAVRAAALATIRDSAHLGLIQISEYHYVHTVEIASYEAFREKVISANTEREAAFIALDKTMHATFLRLATRTESGSFSFDQPMRVNLLRKTS
ncbi:MAG: hypothetical protein ABT940_03515 [Alphaproteobacteria bacterium]